MENAGGSARRRAAAPGLFSRRNQSRNDTSALQGVRSGEKAQKEMGKTLLLSAPNRLCF